MPAAFVAYRDNWRRLHPGWVYRLWADEDVAGTPIAPLVERATTFAAKADCVRLYAVHACGGVYADTDFDWIRPIDEWLRYDAFCARELPYRYANAFFGAAAGHPWVRWQLDRLPEVCGRCPPWGPDLATDAAREAGAGLTTLPTKLVYPYLWTEPRRPASDFPDAYLVHHWAESWKEGTCQPL